MKLTLVAIALFMSMPALADTIECNAGLMTVDHSNDFGTSADGEHIQIVLKDGHGSATATYQNGKYKFVASAFDPNNGDGTFMFQGALVQTAGTKVLGGMMELSSPQTKESGAGVRAIIGNSEALNKVVDKADMLSGDPSWLKQLPQGEVVGVNFECTRYQNN